MDAPLHCMTIQYPKIWYASDPLDQVVDEDDCREAFKQYDPEDCGYIPSTVRAIFS